jgi:hypothetical protein
MARRSHPYFGQINRLEAGRIALPRDTRGRAPRLTPDEEPGVLWDAFRGDPEPV